MRHSREPRIKYGAGAGIQLANSLDTRLRGYDGKGDKNQ